MKLQSIVFINDIILNNDPRRFNQALFNLGVKALINSDGMCIDPPILVRDGGTHSTTYRVYRGRFQVACAKEALKKAGIEQINCYIVEDEKELDMLTEQFYAFRYE